MTITPDKFEIASARRELDMKYAIISDIHGNLEALETVLRDIKSQNIFQSVCLGDIVGECGSPRECLETVQVLGIPCVKGNQEEYCGGEELPEGLNPHSRKVIQWIREQLTADDRQWMNDLKYSLTIANFTIVHATLDAPQRWRYEFDKLAAAASFPFQQTPICFFGHTHIPAAFVRDTSVRGGTYSKIKIDPAKKYFINPGSVGQSRDNNPKAAYAIYDAEAGTVELRRVDYDIARTQKRMRETGL